jgi:DNA polymerase III subunit epsilon
LNFVTIDFETSDYSRESACSVGLVKYQDGKAVDTYYSLIRPPVLYIRPDFTDIHGLTIDDVKDAPVFADLWDSAIKPFIGGFPLVAHNAPFDMGVLHAVLECYKLAVPKLPYFCTLALARRTWPGFQSYSLSVLAEKFGYCRIAQRRRSGDECVKKRRCAFIAVRQSCKVIIILMKLLLWKNEKGYNMFYRYDIWFN